MRPKIISRICAALTNGDRTAVEAGVKELEELDKQLGRG
jgi:hypothetical protein